LRICCSAVFVVLIACATLTLGSCGGAPAANKANSSPSAAPAPSPTPTPTPTAGTTVLDNVQNTRNWLTCGNCGNTGATGPAAGATFTPGVASPSEDGVATQFSIAPTAPYSNAYFYQEHTPVTSQINALIYEFDVYIPQGMENASEGFEFECQQIIGGWVYNFGWQAYYTGKMWRIFDYGLKRWDSTNVPFPGFTPGTWHHIVAEYHNDLTTHTVFHDALTVDGTRYTVNLTHNAYNAGGRDQFTNAVQLDSNKTATPYSVYVDKMTITYK
jgi:hypothetical protein